MTRFEDLLCRTDERREQIRAADTLHGLDYLEVRTSPPADNQRILEVYFIAKANPAGTADLGTLLGDLDTHPELFTITGGVRTRDVRVEEAVRNGDRIELRVNQPGDFSPYILAVDHPRLDPVFRSLEFNFKAGCPNPFDCAPVDECPEPVPSAPAIDYMAKDYASFRQALIDRMSVLNPRWREKNIADLGIAMVELFAYTGDYLSYYQDAVASEAFLETARQRISVRRHARLIDYRMHDGLSARTFVHFRVTTPGVVPAGTQLLPRTTTPTGELLPLVIPAPSVSSALATARVVFELESDVTADPALDEIEIHEWSREDCCLPVGATSADLRSDLTALLGPGGFLLFESETLARQVVRLISVELVTDPLGPDVLTRVTWDSADAFTSAFRLSSDGDHNLTFARGNIGIAHQGRRIEEEHTTGNPAAYRFYRFLLEEAPVSFWRVSQPAEPVTALLAADPAKAAPQVAITNWTRVDTLLGSDPNDRHFTVEVDNEGRALLRFGNGNAGRKPSDGEQLDIVYRTGIGPAGNVAAEGLYHAIAPGVVPDWPAISSLRNPLPAWGGTDPQSLEHVKLTAPASLRGQTFRAVTEDDYAKAAEMLPEVSRAVATFRWTGTWHTVFLTIDPAGSTTLSPETRARVENWIRSFMQTGYDLKVADPIYVPLEIDLTVCVDPGWFRSDVYQKVLRAFSAGDPAGLFHPDRFTFGQALYLSQIQAAAGALEGVRSVSVTKFQRLGRAPAQELQNGAIHVGRTEVIRLDNDPNFAENGVLRVHLEGGK